jgi:sulfite exporter TauE/SafE
MKTWIFQFRYILITALLWLIVIGISQAQNHEGFGAFNKERLSMEKQGMLLLATWSLGNLAWGGIGASNSVGEAKGFHQMNMYWNSVNLIIAGLGYYNAFKEVPGTEFWETIGAQHRMEKILLFNAGLDVGYIAAGLYLNERGKRLNREQWQGFGKSVILQGAFLLSFDLIMYAVMRDHAGDLPKIMEHVTFSGLGVGVRLPLQ